MSDPAKTAETGYPGPGFPRGDDRRRHLQKLAALAAGATAATATVLVVGEQVMRSAGGPRPVTPDPGCETGGGSWISNLWNTEPPRLMGEMPAPEHRRPPPRDEFPEAAGGIAEPSHPGPDPEPRPQGGLAVPDPELRPDEVPTVPDPEPPPGPLPPGKGALEGPDGDGLRSVYLQGSTAAGAPFTVCIRIDPGDDASYQAVLAARREITALLAPLADDPTLARTHTAYGLVSQVVKGATIRQAGVLR